MISRMPVYPTQKIFRTLLEAMSRPGRICPLMLPGTDGPWSSSYLAVAHTLLDHEVSFHVLEPNGHSDMTSQIFAVTKARPATLETADYIFIDGPGSHGQILAAKTGSPDYPDRGATLIYILNERIRHIEGDSLGMVLEGPGIHQPIRGAFHGIVPDEFECIRDMNSEYPLGVDCFFIDPQHDVMAIPRSTTIRII